MLVLGSMGFCGLYVLMEWDNMVGFGLFSDMLLIGVVFVVGLLLVDNIVFWLFVWWVDWLLEKIVGI